MKKLVLTCIMLMTIQGHATELDPWFGTSFQICGKIDYIYQHYHKFDTSCGNVNWAADDHFLHGSLSTTIMADWSVEAEATMAWTKRQHDTLDNFRVTGRYLILDDVVGDPVSLTAGLTYTKAFTHSVHDPSSFHHGKNEFEMHLSVGKELSCGAFWVDRKWAVLALGQADSGYPWGKIQLHWEKNRCDLLRYFGFIKFLYGFGNKRLCCDFEESNELIEVAKFICHDLKHFEGYGRIRHRSIDIGAGVWKTFCSYYNLGLRGAYRVYAHNFPKSAFYVALRMEYPFSL